VSLTGSHVPSCLATELHIVKQANQARFSTQPNENPHSMPNLPASPVSNGANGGRRSVLNSASFSSLW
jgi:hypothetical protein